MVQDHLAAALHAAETQAWAEALGPLIAVWREHASFALATAIEDVSARALEHVPQPIAQTAGTLNAMWFTQAKKGDPAVIGQLCTTLRNTRRSNDLIRRIEMLLAHSTDPRLAMAVCDVVEHSNYPVLQIQMKRFWSRMFSWLPELGDPRVLERALAFAETWADRPEADRAALLARLADTMPALIAAYPEREPLDSDDRETCFAIARVARTHAGGRPRGRGGHAARRDLRRARRRRAARDLRRLARAARIAARRIHRAATREDPHPTDTRAGRSRACPAPYVRCRMAGAADPR